VAADRPHPDGPPPDRTLLKEIASRQWRVTQVLLDPDGDDLWCIESEIDFPPGQVPHGPLIRLHRIGT